MSRLAKDNAIKAIHDNVLEDEATGDEVISEQITITPVYTQNAPNGKSLDLCKQYKRKIEYCNREIMRIHNKLLNKKDQGSADRGNIYIDFQAGMFEALKLNFLNCIANDFNILPVSPIKVELYDEAEE